MKIWIIATVVSFILTLVMGVVFIFMSMVALNGFTTSSEAMPTFLVCNCIVWPIMVGIGTAVDWIIFAIAKQKQSIWSTILLNAALVTLLLGTLATIFYFI